MSAEPRIIEVTGKITLSDGSVSEFDIYADGGWQQWGATRERLGQTVDAVSAMAEAVIDMFEEEE